MRDATIIRLNLAKGAFGQQVYPYPVRGTGMGSTTVAIPASTAGRLADAAANDVSRLLDQGHDESALANVRAARGLIQACNEGEGGKLVAVDADHLMTAASARGVDMRASKAASAFLVNAGVWSGDK